MGINIEVGVRRYNIFTFYILDSVEYDIWYRMYFMIQYFMTLHN